MSLIFKNYTRSLSRSVHYVALFQEFVDTPINGRPSLFRIDSVHQMATSLSTLCSSFNTKSMGHTNIKCQNEPQLPPAQVSYYNGQTAY
jgi:hypothetical protein